MTSDVRELENWEVIRNEMINILIKWIKIKQVYSHIYPSCLKTTNVWPNIALHYQSSCFCFNIEPYHVIVIMGFRFWLNIFSSGCSKCDWHQVYSASTFPSQSVSSIIAFIAVCIFEMHCNLQLWPAWI